MKLILRFQLNDDDRRAIGWLYGKRKRLGSRTDCAQFVTAAVTDALAAIRFDAAGRGNDPHQLTLPLEKAV